MQKPTVQDNVQDSPEAESFPSPEACENRVTSPLAGACRFPGIR